jgi:hypothetical protein
MKRLGGLLVILRCSLASRCTWLRQHCSTRADLPIDPTALLSCSLESRSAWDGPQRCWRPIDRRRRAIRLSSFPKETGGGGLPAFNRALGAETKAAETPRDGDGRPPPASLGDSQSICDDRQAACRPLPIGKSDIRGGWTKVWCVLSSTQRRLRTHCGLLTTAIDA